MHFRTVCVAGTFEGLHAGHQKLLQAAFMHGEYVVIGLTSDQFGKATTSYQFRKKALEAWLAPYYGRYEIFPLDDPVGPAASADWDGLIVTSQNRKTGEYINTLRIKNSKKPLVLIEVDLLPAQDKKPISSTRVKVGEIDKQGRLVMPDNMRKELAIPLGPVLTMLARGPLANGVRTIYTVGDLTTKTFLDLGITPNLAIIDNKVNRKPYNGLKNWKKGKQIIKVTSGPGYISREAINDIKSIFDSGNQYSKLHQILEVTGEEDLLVLPAIMEAPVGSVLYYGQPGQGIVEVVVSKEIKKQVIELVSNFTS